MTGNKILLIFIKVLRFLEKFNTNFFIKFSHYKSMRYNYIHFYLDAEKNKNEITKFYQK